MSGAVLSGFTQLQRNYDKLRGKAVRRVVRKSLNAAATVVVREARKRAPVDTGLLKHSIAKKVWTSRDKKFLVAVIGPRTGLSKIDAKGTAWPPQTYGYWAEFGTRSKFNKTGRGPKAFLRPALDANRVSVMSKMATKAAQEIRKEAAKLRK